MEWVCKSCGKVNKQENTKCVSCHKDRKVVEDKKVVKEKNDVQKTKKSNSTRKCYTIWMYILTDVLMLDVWFILLPLLFLVKIVFPENDGNIIFIVSLIYMSFREIVYSYIVSSERGNIPMYFILMTLSPLILFALWILFSFLEELGLYLALFIVYPRMLVYTDLPIFFIFFRIPVIIGLFIGYRELKHKVWKK